MFPRVLLACCCLAWAASCAARNQFGREVRIERAAFASAGEPLEYFVGIPAGADGSAPLAVFLEGDGSQCQEFREGDWRRFLVRHTGSALLVRPRTFVNSVCGTPEFVRTDFLHRVAELWTLLAELRRTFPGRPVFLVGHSAGAHLALLYASAHPGEIAGIANLGGGLWPLADVLPEITREKARRGQLSPSEADERLAAHERLVAQLPLAPDSSEPMWGRTRRFWGQMFFSGVRETWATTELPVLVLHGSLDLDSVPASSVRQARDELARAGRTNVRFVFLEDAGHDLLSAEAFQLVDEWIRSLQR